MLVIIIIGLCSGILGGVLGIGGATIMIPAMVYILGFSQKLAQGTSIAAMVPPIGILAACVYWKAGNVDIKVALLLAIGFIFGGLVGGLLAQQLPETILKKLFAIFFVIIAIKMWFGK